MDEKRQERLSEWMLSLTEGSQAVIYSIGDEEVELSENDTRAEFVHLLVKCKESIQSKTPTLVTFESFFQENRDIAEAWLDGYYVYRQLGAIPGMIERTLQLSRLDATSIPSEQTTRYISEASKCYIQGFEIATVAMARAALEQAIKERFAQLNVPSSGLVLGKLIKVAQSRNIVLSPDGINFARDLVNRCNAVMHRQPPYNKDAAWEILAGIRALLAEIYSSAEE